VKLRLDIMYNTTTRICSVEGGKRVPSYRYWPTALPHCQNAHTYSAVSSSFFFFSILSCWLFVLFSCSRMFRLIFVFAVVASAFATTSPDQLAEKAAQDLPAIQDAISTGSDTWKVEVNKLFKSPREFRSTEEHARLQELLAFGVEDFHLPLFPTHLNANGQRYPLTMVGGPPAKGKTASVPVVIVPVRVTFNDFPGMPRSVVLDPTKAVANTIKSPFFSDAQFPNQKGQYIDSLQRCAFWNYMDEKHNWHVKLAKPTVKPMIDWTVTPAKRNSTLTKTQSGLYLGEINDWFVYNHLQEYMKTSDIPAGSLIIFLTNNAMGASFGGFHDIFVNEERNSYTYTISAWLDPLLFQGRPGPTDTFILSHELAEWANDPLTTNYVPTWKFPGEDCSQNNLLEVADPMSNGPTADQLDLYYQVRLNNFNYTIQNAMVWEWFTGKPTSAACNGWFTFPRGTAYTRKAEFC
jgi:hypothetical protein